MLKLIALPISLLLPLAVFAETYTVSMKGKAFSKSTLSISRNDTVVFKNEDPFLHNIFSLSDAALFDLGSYPQGESKSVTFEESGIVKVECAIHRNMQLQITVK